MAVFDKKEWLERLEKRAAAGRIDSETLKIEKESIRFIGKLVLWCKKFGYTVDFGWNVESSLHPDGINNVIQINMSSGPECALHTLLHECGHFLSSKRRDYKKRYKYGYALTISSNLKLKRKKKTDVHKFSILEEEFEAWHLGWRLSERLGMKIRKETYIQRKCKALRTYVEWVI